MDVSVCRARLRGSGTTRVWDCRLFVLMHDGEELDFSGRYDTAGEALQALRGVV